MRLRILRKPEHSVLEGYFFQEKRGLENTNVVEMLNLKPSSNDKRLTSLMKHLPSYLGCGDYLVERKDLMLTGMSLDVIPQAAENGESVEFVSASWKEELKFFGD